MPAKFTRASTEVKNTKQALTIKSITTKQALTSKSITTKELSAGKLTTTIPSTQTILSTPTNPLTSTTPSTSTTPVTDSLLKAAEVHREKGHLLKAKEVLESAIILMGNKHQLLHVAEGYLGEILLSMAMSHESYRIQTKALITRIVQFGETSAIARTAMHNLGVVYLAMGKTDKALSMFQRAYRSWQNSVEKCPVELMESMCTMGEWHRYCGQSEMAVSFYRTALNVAFNNYTRCSTVNGLCVEQTHGEYLHLAITRCYNNLAYVYSETGDDDNATKCYLLAADVIMSCGDYDRRNVCTVYSSLSLSLMAIGEIKEAVRYGERALEISRKFHEGTGCEYGRIGNNLATVYMKNGMFEKAIETEMLAVAAFEQSCGEGHAMIGVCMNNMGVAYRALGELHKAADVTERAERMIGIVAGYESKNYIVVLNNLGGLYMELKRHSIAVQLIERAFSNAEKTLGLWNSDTLSIANALHSAYTELGRTSDLERLEKLYTESSVNNKV